MTRPSLEINEKEERRKERKEGSKQGRKKCKFICVTAIAILELALTGQFRTHRILVPKSVGIEGMGHHHLTSSALIF